MISKTLICPHCRGSLGGTAVYGSAVRLGPKHQECPHCGETYLDPARREWDEMTCFRRFEYYLVSAWVSFFPTAIFGAIAVLVILKVFRIRAEEGIWTTIAMVGLVWAWWGVLSVRASLAAIKESKGRTGKTGRKPRRTSASSATPLEPAENRETRSQSYVRRGVPHA